MMVALFVSILIFVVLFLCASSRKNGGQCHTVVKSEELRVRLDWIWVLALQFSKVLGILFKFTKCHGFQLKGIMIRYDDSAIYKVLSIWKGIKLPRIFMFTVTNFFSWLSYFLAYTHVPFLYGVPFLPTLLSIWNPKILRSTAVFKCQPDEFSIMSALFFILHPWLSCISVHVRSLFPFGF